MNRHKNISKDISIIKEQSHIKLTKYIETLKADFFINLSKNTSYHHKDSQEFLYTYLDNRSSREIVFYDTVIQKLHNYVGIHSSEKIYLFFDMDETIVKKNDTGDIDYIRPSLAPLLQTLQQLYPHIVFGICSSRAQEYIDGFIKNHPEYNFVLGYSSRELPWDAPDETRGRMCPSGHYNKAHSMLAIRAELQTDKSFLVDDIIQSQFEEKKMGICIPGGDFYTIPDEGII